MQKLTVRPTNSGPMAFVDAELGPEGNTSGLRPYGRNVLVKMDEVAEASVIPGMTQGIIYSDDIREKHNHGSASGCIIALGQEAFARYENGHAWTGDKPKVGDRVEVVQYAGKIAGGADGHTYRIMDQNSVIAGIDFVEPEFADVEGAVQ